jgi:hypothetical protein
VDARQADGKHPVRTFHMKSAHDTSFMRQFVKHALRLADSAFEQYQHEHAHVFQWLANEQHMADNSGQHVYENRLRSVTRELNEYYSVLPIYAYNATFDLNCGRSCGLFGLLRQLDGPKIKILKKTNRYLMVRSRRLTFYCYMHVNGLHMSLANYLGQFSDDTSVGQKQYFPYSAMRDYASMIAPQLPCYDDFHNELSGVNSLDQQNHTFQRALLVCQQNETRALQYAQLKTVPLAGRTIYAQLVDKWRAERCNCLLDILHGYARAVRIYSFSQYYL